MNDTMYAKEAHSEADLDLASLLKILHAWHDSHATVAHASPAQLLKDRAQAEVQALEALWQGEEDLRRLADLQRWLEENILRLEPLLQARGHALLAQSWACVHPGSRLVDDGRGLMTNAIDRDLQGAGASGPLDPASDLASLLVGLDVRDERRLAFQARDGYLRLAGDDTLPCLLAVYQVVEALSGARRALNRLSDRDDVEQPALLAEAMGGFRRYLAQAEAYTEFRFPPLVIGVGVSGSGKSRFTRTLVERLGAVRLSSDVERRRLHGMYPQADDRRSDVDIFSQDTTERTYQRLAHSAGALLDAGLPVCIDGTCLKRAHRDLLRHQAEARGLPVLLIHFAADDATLRRRITKRAARQSTPLEESLAVLQRQCDMFETFSEEESRLLVRLDTTADNAAETLAGLMQEHMR